MRERAHVERKHIHTWVPSRKVKHSALVRACACGVHQWASLADIVRARIPESLELYADVVWYAD